jgi:MerR family transcriptional regulator/heat shock protein HspR
MPDRTEQERALYIISVAAELAGVHPQTLRTYERKGLLTPKRTAGGTRRYSERDVARVQLIQQLTQEEGINLAGVLRILELEDDIERLQRRLAQVHREVERVQAEASAALREAQQRAGTELVLYRRTQIERHRSGR